MIFAATERLDPPWPSLRASAVFATLLVGAFTVVTGCKSPKQKATEVIEGALETCREADDDFHRVELMAGSDSTEVLAETCHEQMGEVQVEKGHSADVEVGPYTWRAGIDETNGIWVLKGVSWETLDQARNRLSRQDPGENEIERALDLLTKAQETYPKSGWIRLERLDALLRLRKKTRSLKSEDGYKLGDRVSTHLEETIDWAQSDGDRSTEVRARLQVIDFLRSFTRQIQDAKSALGSQDEYYEKSVQVAKEKGNEKEAEKYKKELEELREKRPDKRNLYDKLVKKARIEMCGHLSHLKTDGIEDGELKDRATSTKDRIDCRELLSDEDGEDGGEDDSE